MPDTFADPAVPDMASRPRALGAVIVVVSASLIAAPPNATSLPSMRAVEVRLTGSGTVDSPLGDGVALVMGASGTPTPSQQYVDAADALYLHPLGFTGTTEILTTPERLLFDKAASWAEGAQILTTAIDHQIDGGQVSAENPIVVFGYSQSATLSTLTMEQLHDEGVPSDDVHFVLVGDAAAPSGGIHTIFGTAPPTPDDLYPTDVYTLEYDGFADFPRYPINLLTDLNALIGVFTKHLQYLNLDSDQINNAVLLPGSADLTGEGMTNFYMMPSETLPLLEPLRLLPVIGQPLYDLLEPDARILVNLGYGNIDHGWDPGPANVDTPIGLFPTDLDWSAVLHALADGAQQGIQAAVGDLVDIGAF